MSTNNGIRSLQSFVVLPILATNLLVSPMATLKIPTVAVLANDKNGTLLAEATDNQQQALKEKAAKIDAYFGDKNLPLAGYGEKLVVEAEKNGLPWSMIAAIAMQESTAYKFACKNDPENGFGWASCKTKFDSINQAIETIGLNLGGNNPKTEKHYKDKDVVGILKTYNPPHAYRNYAIEVQAIMKTIENYSVSSQETESA